MRNFLSIIENISEWTGKIISVLFMVTVIVIAFEVVMRYVFRDPTLWGFETMIYLCAVLYMIGGAYTLYHRQHVNVDVLYNRCSPRQKALLDLLTYPFFVLFVGLLLWATTERFWDAFTIGEGSGTVWNPPISPMFLTMAIGCLLLMLQGLADFIRNIYRVLNK
ncbi:TRAP transporter small permease subunit [Dehalococcoidia bacterium]|nr:TRAP transporter small permease subunit [Dehalococcoidia bacterium]